MPSQRRQRKAAQRQNYIDRTTCRMAKCRSYTFAFLQTETVPGETKEEEQRKLVLDEEIQRTRKDQKRGIERMKLIYQEAEKDEEEAQRRRQEEDFDEEQEEEERRKKQEEDNEEAAGPSYENVMESEQDAAYWNGEY